MPLTVGELQALLRIDDSGVSSALDQAMAGLRALDKTWTATLTADVSEVESGAAEADAALDSVEGEAVLGLDAGEVEAGANEADAALDGIEGVAVLGADTGDALGAVSEVESALGAIQDVTVTIGADTSGVDGAIGNLQGGLGGLGGQAGMVGGLLGGGLAEAAEGGLGALGGLTGGMKGLVGAAAGFVGLSTFRGFLGSAEEAQVSVAKLDNVIRTMGAGSWITRDQITDMASSIQATTGISDELIANGSAMLLTFADVRNEVGAGNDVFNRANAAMVDMADFMGGDMQGAAVMLGKALNDPIKGMNAMSRTGTTFSQSQREAIKAMAESGDLLGAQKVILEAVEQQYGGTAAATATASEKMGASLADVSESIGTALLPMIEAVAPGIQRLAEMFMSLPGPLQVLIVAAPLLGLALAGVAAVVPIVAGGLGLLAGLFSPIGLAIMAVVGIGYLLIAHWDTIKDVAGDVWAAVSSAVGDAAGWVGDRIGDMLDFFTGLWRGTQDRVGSFVGLIASIPGAIGDIFAGAGSWLVNAGKNIVIGLWNGFADMTGWLFRQITGFVDDVIGWVTSGFGIFSPSKVFRERGRQLPAGLALGIMDNLPMVEDAIGSMVRLPEMSVPVPAGAGGHMAGMASGGSGERPIVVHVAGSVVTTRDIARDVQAFLGERR
jgi:hypothetical protein